MYKWVSVRILQISFLGILLLLLHCGKKEGEVSSGILDDRGVPLVLTGFPERIISLVPSITEILYALQGESFLVGVTLYCDYPPEAQSLPKVGDLVHPSLERIIDLKPDLIFATTPLQSLVIERLESLGMKVFVLQPESVEAIQTSIMKIGQIIGREREGELLLQKMREDLSRMEEKVKRLTERKRVFIEIGINPLISAGENSFVGELIQRAGGVNVVKGNDPYPLINPERVIARDPEVILLTHPGSSTEEVMKRLGWGGVTAIQEGHVEVDLDPDLIQRPGPRIAEGVNLLFQKIYPEQN